MAAVDARSLLLLLLLQHQLCRLLRGQFQELAQVRLHAPPGKHVNAHSHPAADRGFMLPRQCEEESLQLLTVINEQRGCRTTTRRAQFAQLRFSPLASWRKLPVDQIERAPASPDPIVLRRRHASLPLAQPPKAQQPCLSPFEIPDLGFSCATVVGQLQLLRPSFCLRIVCGVCVCV